MSKIEPRVLQLGVFTTNQLAPEGDEYITTEDDPRGEEKMDKDGVLEGDREYRIKTFTLPDRGNKLFMMATECAKELNYRDSYLLFNKNKSLYKMIASNADKEKLINLKFLPYSFRSRQIGVVTAKSMFRQFGSRVIRGGKRVKDDYWELKALEQGFTEDDPVVGDNTKKHFMTQHHKQNKDHDHSNTPTQHTRSQSGTISSKFGPSPVNANSAVFIPGSGINGSFDFHDKHSKRKHEGGNHDFATQLLAAQHQVSDFNKYINNQRKLRIATWGQFWKLRQKQQASLLNEGIRQYLETETEDEMVIQQKQQQLEAVLPRPQLGALETEPPQPAIVEPPQPRRMMPQHPPHHVPPPNPAMQAQQQASMQAQQPMGHPHKMRKTSNTAQLHMMRQQQQQQPPQHHQQPQYPPTQQYMSPQYAAQYNQWQRQPPVHPQAQGAPPQQWMGGVNYYQQ